MAEENKITITLSQNEVDLLILSMDTSREWLQDQKNNIFGAMVGISKIDTLCANIDQLKAKLTGE